MAGWLSRATEAFRRQSPPAPEPFEVECDCGGRVRGDRLSIPQRPPCPNCGRPVFVLPANPYPRPLNIVSKKLNHKATGSKSVANEPPSKEVSQSAKPRQSISTDVEKRRGTPRDESSAISIEPRARLVTPFRLTVTAMLFICSLTGWGLWRRHQFESAKNIVATATEKGLRAIEERDFAIAARELERARQAVDLLKRADAEANMIRRMSQEATAANGLASESLFELLRESMADVKPSDPESKRFEGLYQNTWVLFDSSLVVPESDSQPCVLDLPVFYRGVPIRIEISSPQLRTAATHSGDEGATRVIFAAQLGRLIPAKNESSESILILRSDSAFLWTSYDTYLALGYRENDAEEQRLTRTILERQLEISGEAK